jgi:hypothetical protein
MKVNRYLYPLDIKDYQIVDEIYNGIYKDGKLA